MYSVAKSDPAARPGGLALSGAFNWTGLLLLLTAALLVLSPAGASAQENNEDREPGRRIVPNAIFNEQRIEQVLTVIQSETGVSITAFGRVPGERISVFERDIELENLLNRITTPKGWVWWRLDDGGYGIADEAWYQSNILPTLTIIKIFRPDHVRASELQQSISSLLTQGIGSAQPDDRTNKLIVEDLPEVIERIERLIREIDVQLMTRVFYIRNGDVADIAQKIETYKSDPGTIEVDAKTHQIIVTDLLSNIKRMELLIDILDVGPEIVIYDVHNIGLEGRDLEDLQTIIESIRTPDLLFEINHKQGVFILEDVPEVHERVEQILESFDQPVKQVLIQGEILSTSFSRQFNFGLRRAIVSGDPITAPESLTDGGSSDGPLPEIGFGYNFIGMQGSSIGAGILSDQAIFEWQATFQDSTTRVLLQPRLLVKNQESSRVFVGSEEPFLTTFFNDTNVGVSRSTGQQTVTDGLTFEITPSISNSYLVEMDIRIDNDNAQPVEVQSGGQTTTLIRKDRQTVETVLTIPSGQTRVIGGLITSSRSETAGGIPFLSKIPVVGGLLFGNRSFGDSRDNLQLFLTPTVVEDVIPRATSEDGKRGRLVTGYDRVLGSYDPFGLEGEMQFEEIDDLIPEDLLRDIDPDDAEGAIEEMLLERTPRAVMDEEEATSSYDPRRARSTGTASSPPPTQREQQRNNAQQQQQQQQRQTTTQQQREPSRQTGGTQRTPSPPPRTPGSTTTETRY